jgi:hypothetical protein
VIAPPIPRTTEDCLAEVPAARPKLIVANAAAVIHDVAPCRTTHRAEFAGVFTGHGSHGNHAANYVLPLGVNRAAVEL